MPYQNPYLPQQGYGYHQQYQNNQFQQGPMQQSPIHGFVYVTGIDGAKAYQMPPNSEMPLFDSTSDNRMFIKTTDGAGFPTIRVVRCTPEEAQPQQAEEWATVDDLASMRKELEELKQSVYEMGGTRGKHVPTTSE